VDVFFGDGRFTGPDAIEVAGATLRFKRALVATGTRASAPPIPGLAEAGFLTNETVFSLTELPARVAVIGAGPIGCELAQAFRRFGSEVTVLEVEPQIMPREDPDAAACVATAFAREDVRMLCGARIQRVERVGSERRLHVEHRGTSLTIAVDAILVGAGRTPNVGDLGLEQAGITCDPKQGLVVDDRLRTSNRRVFGAGDVCSRFKFTHAADALARIAIQNALFLGRARASGLIIPWCTYTDPEVAHVGLTEREAREQGVDVATIVQPLTDVDRARLDGETEGFVKMHVRRGTDRILGGTIVARHAGDMIGEVTLAMLARRGLGTLARTIHPYPTQAEAIKKSGDAYNRTRLTPRVKWLLRQVIAWQR
jgi:pyruvate/2-oxoglutarate dehydrogenase complex dihydrolipoamide dehydrogenase (E3) component